MRPVSGHPLIHAPWGEDGLHYVGIPTFTKCKLSNSPLRAHTHSLLNCMAFILG